MSEMEKSTRERYEPAYLLAHKLIDKLAIIVGNCDLLSAQAQASSECAKRLDLIRDVAKEIAKELQQDEYQLLEAARSVGRQKHYVA